MRLPPDKASAMEMSGAHDSAPSPLHHASPGGSGDVAAFEWDPDTDSLPNSVNNPNTSAPPASKSKHAWRMPVNDRPGIAKSNSINMRALPQEVRILEQFSTASTPLCPSHTFCVQFIGLQMETFHEHICAILYVTIAMNANTPGSLLIPSDCTYSPHPL